MKVTQLSLVTDLHIEGVGALGLRIFKEARDPKRCDIDMSLYKDVGVLVKSKGKSVIVPWGNIRHAVVEEAKEKS